MAAAMMQEAAAASGTKKKKEASSSAREYKAVMKLVESKSPVYGISFNLVDSRFFDMFASVCENKVTVFKCTADGSTTAMQAYLDDDKDELFYTVTWSCGTDGSSLLAAAGKAGVIRIIDCQQKKVTRSLIGHGGSVNEVRVQPRMPWLILSASKDESLRLWNVSTGVCVFIFAGASGHRNEVLSADFHPGDSCLLASCGMDSTIRVWSFKELWGSVVESQNWQHNPSTFRTKIIQFPLYVVYDVHTNYIDCIRWLGDFVLSKSVDNEIVMWRWLTTDPSAPLSEGEVDILQRYPIPECDIWFVKFAFDLNCNLLCIGNREGKLFLWDLHHCPPVQLCQLSHKECKYPVRQTAVSHDGRTILACCDNGTIWKWDKVR